MKTTLIKLGALVILTQLTLTGQLRAQALAETDSPDSIVQITANAEGLSRVDPTTLPMFASCYWTVYPGTGPLPLPCPPQDLSAPIFEIANGYYLVDETGGAVSVSVSQTGTRATTSSAVAATVDRQGNAIADLIEQIQARQSPQMMMMASATDISSPDGSSGGGGYGPDGLTNSYSAPNYGTNMWLLETNISFGIVSGIISNTAASVRLELQYTFDLTQPWRSADWFVYGSQTTNWTAFSIPAVSSSNLFLRVKSWGVDANGLPIWWEQQYGLANVDPNALSSAGDGWTIYQKYVLGVAPSAWYTPPAPQGLAVNFNQSALTAAIIWLPSRGNVSNYTVEKSYQAHLGGSTQTSDYTVSSGTSYQDSISGNSPDVANGNGYNISYKVKANYQNGNSSGWTSLVPLQQTTVAGAITPGLSGLSTLVALGIPASASLVRLVFIDESALSNNNTSFNYTEDIPVSSFTNGLYPMPTAWNPPANDTYGNASYAVFVKSVDSSGNSSAPNPVATNWVQMPFYDGRAQLKENLIFQLRAAPTSAAFSFYFPTNYGGGVSYEYDREYDYPSSYACAGLYPFTGPEYFAGDVATGWGIGYGGNYGGLDIFLPFEENYLFRNFAYNLSDSDTNGMLTTGAGYPDIGNANFVLLPPPTYLFHTNGTSSFSDLLSPSHSTFLLPGQFDEYLSGDGPINFDTDGNTYYSLSLSSTSSNWFGLPFVSGCLAYQTVDNNWNYAGFWTNLVSAGKSSTYSANSADIFMAQYYGNVYLGTAQPKFNTVKYCFYQPRYDWLPGSVYFSPTNDSPQLMVWNGSGYNATNDVPYLIVPAGTWAQLAGYAKLAVTNGAPGVYGYLGQYFQAAYQVDGNGNITTNGAGVISPYGNYFATAGGQAALVTMPDLDTGLQGTCMVYSVALALDKNHDGKMDLSLGSGDATSTNAPMVYWCNNNFDRYALDGSDNVYYDDDVSDTSQAAGCYYTPNVPTPDCNFLDGAGNRAISCTRDLQDFTRLWVCGITSNLLTVLPIGSTITLGMTAVNGQIPTIDIFAAADTNGSVGYLTNETTAVMQESKPYIGRLGPGQSIQLNAGTFANHWAGNYFIWCGVSNGIGGVTLTIRDSHGKILTQSTSYIQIVDIKQMYERWTVGDDPTQIPTNTAALGTEDLPAGVPAFQYTVPADTNTPYILFVHGWNMDRYDKDRFAESAFKRLYWQGYQGRFGMFRWPTDFAFTGSLLQLAITSARDNYDRSEYNAWRSGISLLNKLEDLNTKYPGHVYMLAHSMGNIVAGEALRLAGTNQVVNTYVASQAAVSAHTYDANTNHVPNYSFFYPPWSLSADTPNIYGNWFIGNDGGGAGTVINFYNTNDFALQRSVWQLNQLFKPDQLVRVNDVNWTYGYRGIPSDPTPWNNFYKQYSTLGIVNFDIVNVLTNRYEVMAFAAQSWTTAFGATPNVGNVAGSVYLGRVTNPQIWPSDSVHPNHPYDEHFYHSAEFRGEYWEQQGYWKVLLGNEAFNLK